MAQMKIVVFETFIVAIGLASVVFGGFVMHHYEALARSAKSYDQTHRCVASVLHVGLFWSTAGADPPVQSCSLPADCRLVAVHDAPASASLVLAILNTTGARAGACDGVEPGAQIVLGAAHMSAAAANAVLAHAIGAEGEYHVRYSVSHAQLFVYNASAAAPAVGNALAATQAARSLDYWRKRMPLGAIMMLVGFAMITCSVFIDFKRGGGALLFELEVDADESELRLLRGHSTN